MKRKSKSGTKPKGIITASGNVPRPGQASPATIVLTQPRRFGIDIADYTSAIRNAENVDFPRRSSLYDLYADILMDTHLSCVIDKRRNAVLSSPVEFWRDGTPDDSIGEQIRSPWFNKLLSDIIDSKMWGFSLCQFYKQGDWIDYDLVPRKHADPVRRLILRHQTDITGTSWDEYPDLLFIGKADDLGLLAKAAPWVIYKRNTTGDWSQFSEVFGMPIQEYTYDTDDEDSRQRAIDDAAGAGALAVFVHGKDTTLNLVEAGNKTGSADVYEKLCERCNSEISKLILGNTLTTETADTGTQALGSVHKKVEDQLAQADRRYILDVLNYDMADIFQRMGIDTSGGEFVYPEKKDMDPTAKMAILSQLKASFGLPMSDDYLYTTFSVEKPDNYSEQKKRQQEELDGQKLLRLAAAAGEDGEGEGSAQSNAIASGGKQGKPSGWIKTSFIDRLKGFFGIAPQPDGADSDW